MYREAIKQLEKWKTSVDRKPLVLRGARQVGKTWLAVEFGRLNFQSVCYVNMDNNQRMMDLFEMDYDLDRIVAGLELEGGVAIDPQNTLIIFDEVQEVPRALGALKYFYEQRPDYHIVVAGSLLGVALHPGTSFPVGKVSFVDLYPLSFSEFLRATGMRRHAKLVTQASDWSLIGVVNSELVDAMKKYYVVGGMPEAVKNYATTESLLGVREVQQHIIDAYEQDFSKHAPVNLVPRLREIWESIPAQLARENKKFIFGAVRPGARSREYEAALLWLEDAGMAGRVTRVNKPAVPIKSYEDRMAFKLFALDIGLLGAKSGLNPSAILDGDAVFEEYKGALAEQFVYQELVGAGKVPYYFANDSSRGEIDFVVDIAGQVVPIEVKSDKSLQARSLTEFVAKYRVAHAVKLSTRAPMPQSPVANLPLYMTAHLDQAFASKT